MNDVLKAIEDFGIVPVVVIDNADDAVPLCKAMAEGGLPLAEITFRTAAAEQAIKNVTKELPDILVGAGTVLTTEQAQRAMDAGSKFIVSPGFDPVVVKYCLDKGVPITPGCSNPTDLAAAVGFGLEVVKFFPAEALGGLNMLKAIAAPYGGLRFIPTGGVTTANLNDYLSFNKILACGGTWIAKADVIKAGNFEEITRVTREAVQTMLGFKLAHVGINTPDADASLAITKALSGLFGMPVKEGNSSNFAGTAFEVMKSMYLGKNGHIAIETANIKRAIAYFERMGVAVDMSTAKGDPMVAVYLKDEVGGFAFHLLQKK